MHSRIQELLRYLDDTLADLRAAVDTVPSELREHRPAPDRWSAAEVIEHLSIVENRIARMATAQIEAGRARGLNKDADQTGLLQEFDAATVLDRSRPIVASDAAQPRQGLDMPAAWAALLQAREAVRTAVLSGDGLALGELVVPHSVLGHLNLYHWIAFVGAHELRHAAQIREIATQFATSGPPDPMRILSAARSVLLVDRPNTDVPRALLEAGFAVFGYSPGSYSAVAISADPPDAGDLVFRPIDAHPARVDIVCVYRPAIELPDIVSNLVLPSGARTLWLQPPNTSAEARQLAAAHGLAFIEGIDIAEAARTIRQQA